MNAIVYTSNTGYTERYAKLLSIKTGLPAYTMEEAAKALRPGAEIIYMGWIMAGTVKGRAKAAKRYTLKAVCAVGMSVPTEDSARDVAANNHMNGARAFFLRGGYDAAKLKGFNKLIMKVVVPAMRAGLEKTPDRTPDEEASLEMLKNGGDFVSADALEPIITWLEEERAAGE